jgi:hypothetical protein
MAIYFGECAKEVSDRQLLEKGDRNSLKKAKIQVILKSLAVKLKPLSRLAS